MSKYEDALEKAREWMHNVNQGGHAMLIDIFPELGEGLDPRYDGRKQEQPSLPTNMDEVAEEIVKNWLAYGDGEYKKLVIAGVEWMAGQGVTLNLFIDDLSCGAYNACVEQGLTSEDDVIVQIRKKEEKTYD